MSDNSPTSTQIGGGVAGWVGGGGGGGAPPVIPSKGGYWLGGKFVSTDPGSAFYKSPQQLANEAAGLDQWGQNPANIGNPNTGWFNTEGEWLPPGYRSNTQVPGNPTRDMAQPFRGADGKLYYRSKPVGDYTGKYGGQDVGDVYGAPPLETPLNTVDVNRLEAKYGVADFLKGWYQPTTLDTLRGSEYSGSPQTYEEANAISEYLNAKGTLPTSEWMQSYMDQNFPNRGQSNAGMTYFPGSTPFEIGLRGSGDTLSRNKYGVMEGPFFNANQEYVKANNLTTLPREAPPTKTLPVVVPTIEELQSNYTDKLNEYWNDKYNSDFVVDSQKAYASFFEKNDRAPNDKEKAVIDASLQAKYKAAMDAVEKEVQQAETKGLSLDKYPNYKDIVGRYGDIFMQEPYLKNKMMQEKALKEKKPERPAYGSNPQYMPPAISDPQGDYSRFVQSLGVSPAAVSWLSAQYPTIVQGWDGKGSVIDYARARIQASLNQYEGRFAQNSRYAPPTTGRFIPNVR